MDKIKIRQGKTPIRQIRYKQIDKIQTDAIRYNKTNTVDQSIDGLKPRSSLATSSNVPGIVETLKDWGLVSHHDVLHIVYTVNTRSLHLPFSIITIITIILIIIINNNNTFRLTPNVSNFSAQSAYGSTAYAVLTVWKFRDF